MRLGILYSSGKDSTFALWYYLQQSWDVQCLLSLHPKNPDSFMFQNPSVELLRIQADSLQLPLIIQQTLGEEGLELEDLRELLKKAKQEFGIEGVATGALASDYQEQRINAVCHELGLKTFSPLWHKNQEKLLRELIRAGFDVRMTRIAADGLDASWLGRRLIQEDVERLLQLRDRVGINVGGEGGEFESIVLDGPIFSFPITISFEKQMETECRGELLLRTIDR